MCNGRSLGESICSFLERKDFVFFLLSLDTKLGFISQRESPTVSFTTHASLVPLWKNIYSYFLASQKKACGENKYKF
jgi:hypothetical protein